MSVAQQSSKRDLAQRGWTMKQRLAAVIASGLVLGSLMAGSVLARDINAEYGVGATVGSIESEDSEEHSVYSYLSHSRGESEDDA